MRQNYNRRAFVGMREIGRVGGIVLNGNSFNRTFPGQYGNLDLRRGRFEFFGTQRSGGWVESAFEIELDARRGREVFVTICDDVL